MVRCNWGGRKHAAVATTFGVLRGTRARARARVCVCVFSTVPWHRDGEETRHTYLEQDYPVSVAAKRSRRHDTSPGSHLVTLPRRRDARQTEKFMSKRIDLCHPPPAWRSVA